MGETKMKVSSRLKQESGMHIAVKRALTIVDMGTVIYANKYL